MTEPTKGALRIVQPGEAESHWQPVPANGFIEVHVAPRNTDMDTPIGFGRQHVAPGGYVREHAHDKNEEIIHVVAGTGHAIIEGERHPMRPGTTFFLGRNRVHTFVNDGDEDMVFTWLLLPNGLEDFFRDIGRPRTTGEPAPAPFPRPTDVLAIEARTVFAPPTPGSTRKPT